MSGCIREEIRVNKYIPEAKIPAVISFGRCKSHFLKIKKKKTPWKFQVTSCLVNVTKDRQCSLSTLLRFGENHLAERETARSTLFDMKTRRVLGPKWAKTIIKRKEKKNKRKRKTKCGGIMGSFEENGPTLEIGCGKIFREKKNNSKFQILNLQIPCARTLRFWL